ncbi:MAG: AAA family ATPase [Gemmataceae bacterium]|nr:AAA family ATPase [Gemmataceae bacterium]
MPQAESLEQRRPLFLRDLVGNTHVTYRLAEQMKRGTVPNRVFLYGPSGSGKTTVARILARHFFCRNRVGIGDPCGRCERCLRSLEDELYHHEWTAALLEERWRWWDENGQSVLYAPWFTFFLDEAQDLSERHQKALYRDLEQARALVIFATTHKHAIQDALLNRFGANVYEMRRPSVEESVAHLLRVCGGKQLQADPQALARVVQHFTCDLRRCIDFVYTAEQQAPEGRIDDTFVNLVLGIDKPRVTSEAAVGDGRLML